jgi:hypothetical protein
MSIQTHTITLDTLPTRSAPGLRWAMGTLDTLFFLTAAVFIWLAPCGGWANYIFSASMWYNNDPGGAYVGSGLFFLSGWNPPAFPGHPGLPLQLIIAVIAQAGHGLYALAGGSEPYLRFWARHISWLFCLSALVVAAIHVLSFHVLYAFARKLLDDAHTAFLAVLAYATLMPTLYFATRISVEPILVTFFLLTLLSLWNMEEALANGRQRRACYLAAAAGVYSVGAFFTKMHLAGPLIPFALLQLLLQGRGDQRQWLQRIREKLVPAAGFVIAAAVAFLPGCLKMDWKTFFGLWIRFSPGAKQYVSQSGDTASNYAPTLGGIAAGIQGNIVDFVPLYFKGMTSTGVFTITETVFVIFAMLGTIWFCRAYPHKRRLVLWPALYGLLILPVLCYRVWWHYWFIFLAVGSVFFAFALTRLIERSPIHRLGARAAFAGSIALVLLIHSGSMILVLNSKLKDVQSYRQTMRAYHQALARVPENQRIVVLGETRSLWEIHGVRPSWVPRGREFIRTFESLFVPIKKPDRLTLAWFQRSDIGLILDCRQSPIRVQTPSEWWAMEWAARRRARTPAPTPPRPTGTAASNPTTDRAGQIQLP